MEYNNVETTAKKWNMSVRRVQDLCKLGRVPGAVRWGTVWLIPAAIPRPVDGRTKASREEAQQNVPLLRKSPFLTMTNLYNTPGTAEDCIASLEYYPEAQALFAAEIAYSRGQVDTVYEHAKYFLDAHSGFYAILSGGMLLALCAMWEGDVQLWNKAKKHMLEAPWKDAVDRDIVSLSLAASDSAIRNTKDFPEWFARGCFDALPKDSHPAARVYYVKYLLIKSQEMAIGAEKTAGVQGLDMLRMLPYVIEPMISQMVADKIIMAEIYLRLMCAVAYRQIGEDSRAAVHLDKAICLCLADGMYGPLVEHRRQLGLFLDDRLAMIDPEALKTVKELHKKLHAGWTKLHNAVLQKTVSAALSPREREVARLAAFGMSDSQIAKQLYLSESSVKVLIRTAKNKTGVEKRMELVGFI